MKNSPGRVLFVAFLALLLVIFVANLMGGPLATGIGLQNNAPKELTLSEFEKEVTSGNVSTAEWQGNTVRGELASGTKYTARVVPAESDTGSRLLDTMQAQSVQYKLLDPPVSQTLLPFLGMILGPLLLIGFFIYMWRQSQSGGNQAMSFGRSRAKRANDQGPKVTFADVAGIDEAKHELFEIVDFLRNTKKYTALGAKIPKGVLLTGPPGVGKTYLARAIAGEAGVPFFHISGSDFVEMFVGVGAARVRDLFETAKAHRPSLIFIDEIDAVGRQRGAGLGGGHDEREQTLNQLLVEMDGFDVNSGVIMIAATNRPDVLDPALLRPGRFDRQIVVDAPDSDGREAILKIHAKGKPFSDDVAFDVLAKRTPGFTGADLANALNESALLAARYNRHKIEMDDIEEALDRVIAGPQRKSRIMDEHERLVIAYHEAGHAVVGHLLEKTDPVHKVTILPRGMSLGATWHLPEKDSFLVSKQELEEDIVGLLGGRVAEEQRFGDVTTGASNDLQRVTAIARAMVTQYGMSDRLGTLAIGRHSRNPFLGRDISEDRDYSEDVARMIDEEVKQIVETAHSRAQDLLIQHRDKLEAVVEALLKHETLDKAEFQAIMNGEPMPERKRTPEVKPDPENEERNVSERTSTGNGRMEPDPA
ncbi:MAG: ATP-dependent zinc metalloprotease FtsH [Fimbriimonadaceae bacterium]|nr:ATP-dependent zinc metalloprotease FtsH [Fimbriimonadaceae bacterium]